METINNQIIMTTEDKELIKQAIADILYSYIATNEVVTGSNRADEFTIETTHLDMIMETNLQDITDELTDYVVEHIHNNFINI